MEENGHWWVWQNGGVAPWSSQWGQFVKWAWPRWGGGAVGRGYRRGVHSLVGSVEGCDQWEVLVCRVGVANACGRGYGVDERSLVGAIEGGVAP